MDKISNNNTISWLQAIERDYIHGGDESFDNKRKCALQTAIYSIEKLEKIEQIIKKYGLADVTRDDVNNTISGFEYEIIREVLEKE